MTDVIIRFFEIDQNIETTTIMKIKMNQSITKNFRIICHQNLLLTNNLTGKS